MASTTFVYQDAVDAARQQVSDAAGRRLTDADIEQRCIPQVLVQLRSDRPDLFLGVIDSANLKPSLADPCVFDDTGYDAFVEALVAKITSMDEESMSSGQSAAADARSERSRRS